MNSSRSSSSNGETAIGKDLKKSFFQSISLPALGLFVLYCIDCIRVSFIILSPHP